MLRYLVTLQFVYPFSCPWTLDFSPVFGYFELGCYKHLSKSVWMYNFTFLGKYLEMEFLGYIFKVNFYKEVSNCFSKVVESFYTITNSISKFQSSPQLHQRLVLLVFYILVI